MKIKNINEDLQKLQLKIEKIVRSYGLDFFRTVFQICDTEAVNILAAREGFPERYPHWKFGMNYSNFKDNSEYDLGKIYELVINTDPCYAYLLDINTFMDQKLVMAHVYGHNDFFKNNIWFSKTNRGMMNVMATHSSKIRKYMNRYGQDEVENFITDILSLDNLISLDNLYFDEENEQKDALLFLMKKADLKEWQLDVIGMIRDEAYYYVPQRMTKIMNEGWASYWHTEIMIKHLLTSEEIIKFASTNAGVFNLEGNPYNPYKLGIELFRDIKYRWDTGRYGAEYEACEDSERLKNWDTKEGRGLEKILEVRKTHNDYMFIDEFFTKDFVKRTGLYPLEEFEKIKSNLLLSLNNASMPAIRIFDKDHSRITIKHLHHNEHVLKNKYIKNILEILQKYTGKTIVIESFNGKKEEVYYL